ncbi:MAG: hypothetical protein E7034_04005 [Akkermansiaceae bacterium]|nr:hypothetical protein [Akkermansiaceae bacterium]
MSLRSTALWMLLFPVLLGSCSLLQTQPEEKPQDKSRRMMGFEDAMPQVGNPLVPGTGDPNAVNYNVSTSEELAQIDNGAEGEVYFTDPDNPDKEIEGITNAFENRRGGNGWMEDYGRAIRFAHRECRPMIIWFHDSVISPKSKELGEALLDSPEFNEWCRDRVVRVKLDSGASIDDATRDHARYSRNAINRLSLRYGLSRKPSMAVVSPSGKLMVGIDGYNGFVQEVEMLLKKGVEDCEKDIDAMRDRLADRGYRTWHAARGNMSLFAKLQRYDEKNSMVYLREYGGKTSRTKLKRFCAEDRAHILQWQQEKEAKKAKKKQHRES